MARRRDVVALVAIVCAIGGAVAGATAALIAALVLTPTEPVTAGDVALMALGYGATTAVVAAGLGTAVAFGALRRVSLRRILVCGTLGTAAGLGYGWLGGPWAWHHFGQMGVVGFLIGAVLARLTSRGLKAKLESERVEASA
jgi:MFS family permease